LAVIVFIVHQLERKWFWKWFQWYHISLPFSWYELCYSFIFRRILWTI